MESDSFPSWYSTTGGSLLVLRSLTELKRMSRPETTLMIFSVGLGSKIKYHIIFDQIPQY